MRAKDETGKRYGRLTVVSRIERPGKGLFWKCVCDCGNESVVWGANLRNGNSKSCGCLGRENKLASKTTHGKAHTREYHVWLTMKSRCRNPKNHKYADYGGRGIKICKRWEVFDNFYADMGDRPSDAHSIDRIDNDGDYTPDNCRWATTEQQQGNKRSNRVLEWNGKRQTVKEWGRELGISSNVISSRLYRGWSVERALATPVKPRNSKDLETLDGG